MEELVKYMRALVFLQVEQISGAKSFAGKPELLLSKAGFTAREIATLLGKKEPAVAKAISRARQAEKGNGRSDE